EIAGQDVERLLLSPMRVRNGATAGIDHGFEYPQRAIGLGRSEFHRGGVTLYPGGDALVAADEDAVAARPPGIVRVGYRELEGQRNPAFWSEHWPISSVSGDMLVCLPQSVDLGDGPFQAVAGKRFELGHGWIGVGHGQFCDDEFRLQPGM